MKIAIISTLPWEANSTGLIYGQCQGDDDNAPFIADVCDSPLDYTPDEQARAEFITRACNAHPDLVDALQDALLALNTAKNFRVRETTSYAIASRIGRALAKAEGGGS